MDTYLFVHRQPHGYSGSPGAAAAWEAWFRELGEALVDKGNAVLGNRSVTGNAGTVLALGGYTIVSAADLEAATRLAGGCPIVQEGGAVEVGQLSPVPGRQHPARTF